MSHPSPGEGIRTATPGTPVGDVAVDDGCYRLLSREVQEDAALTETFLAQESSRSAWGPHLQHGGPVAGLLVRGMSRCAARPGTRISRIVVEILGPIPPAVVRVRAWVERPGRRIQLLAAELLAELPDGGWRPVARARAWRLATQPTADVAYRADRVLPPPGAAVHDPVAGGLPDAFMMGFVAALEWQVVTPFGQFGGPSMAWLRLAQPLVVGEAPTALERAAAIADVANGVGARLDMTAWTFLNTDLTIHLFAEPAGEWFGIEAETSVGPDGIGLSAAVMHAHDGPIGRIEQTLLVERRATRVG